MPHFRSRGARAGVAGALALLSQQDAVFIAFAR